MEWVALGALAVAVVTVTALVVTGRLDPAGLSEPTSTVPPFVMPEHPTSADVDPLHIGTALYGYVPAEVDAALVERRDRLAAQERALAERGLSDAERDGHVHPDA